MLRILQIKKFNESKFDRLTKYDCIYKSKNNKKFINIKVVINYDEHNIYIHTPAELVGNIQMKSELFFNKNMIFKDFINEKIEDAEHKLLIDDDKLEKYEN